MPEKLIDLGLAGGVLFLFSLVLRWLMSIQNQRLEDIEKALKVLIASNRKRNLLLEKLVGKVHDDDLNGGE